jgi:hypothetical protein
LGSFCQKSHLIAELIDSPKGCTRSSPLNSPSPR